MVRFIIILAGSCMTENRIRTLLKLKVKGFSDRLFLVGSIVEGKPQYKMSVDFLINDLEGIVKDARKALEKARKEQADAEVEAKKVVRPKTSFKW